MILYYGSNGLINLRGSQTVDDIYLKDMMGEREND